MPNWTEEKFASEIKYHEGMYPSWVYMWRRNARCPRIIIIARPSTPLLCRLVTALEDGFVFMGLGLPAMFKTWDHLLVFLFEPDDYPLIMKALDALGYGGKE